MTISAKAKSILKWFGTLLGCIFVLFVVALSIGDYYISSHKEKVIASIKEKVENATGAKLDIGGLDVSIWRSFPRLRVGLTDVELKDTVFKVPLLRFSSIYTKVDLLQALFGNVKVGEIRLVDGQVNLLTDSSGYSNLSIFASRRPDKDTIKKSGGLDLPVRNIYLERVRFVLDDLKKAETLRHQRQ